MEKNQDNLDLLRKISKKSNASQRMLAEELGFRVVEKYFTPQEVYDADGAFFTGTAAEVAGIKSLDGHVFKFPWEHTMGVELASAYKNRVQKKEYKHFELV